MYLWDTRELLRLRCQDLTSKTGPSLLSVRGGLGKSEKNKCPIFTSRDSNIPSDTQAPSVTAHLLMYKYVYLPISERLYNQKGFEVSELVSSCHSPMVGPTTFLL